jgi:uncharacterized membrane protein/mono/diheme cytochrome c family protein
MMGLDLVFALAPATDDGLIAPGVARLLGRLHPAVVHFPIALLLTGALFEFFSLFRPKAGRSTAALACIVVGAIGAAVAAWFGWVSAEVEPPGSSAAQTLFLHRWTGVGLAVVAIVTAILALMSGPTRLWARNGYRGGLGVSVLLVSAGGYFGGELVHGDGYILDAIRAINDPVEAPSDLPAPPPVVAVDTGAEPAIVFARDIKPILDARCVECHGPRKKKAGLRLDSVAAMFSDDPEYWVVVPGEPDDSLLIRRVVLPPDDPDHMPARGEPMTAEEIDLVRTWIAEHVAVPATDAAETTAATPVADPSPRAAAADTGATTRALAVLRERGAVAMPVAEDRNDVDVNFSVADPPAGDADLALLSGLEPTLTWLSLARSAVTNEGLAQLSGFVALRRLHLENTSVGDAGVAHLDGLVDLEYLNLYGTEVTDAGLAHVEKLPALRKLYLWQTQVTDEGMERLRAARPDLEVVGAVERAPVVAAAEPETEEAAGETVAADAEKLPPCCASAKAAGGECTHACCVEARAAGKTCEVCAAP